MSHRNNLGDLATCTRRAGGVTYPSSPGPVDAWKPVVCAHAAGAGTEQDIEDRCFFFTAWVPKH